LIVFNYHNYKVNDKAYYVTTTKILNKVGVERLADKSLYTINEAGDIYRSGNFLSDWLVKWYQNPELILKGKMELKKKYLIQDVTVSQLMVNMPWLLYAYKD
jgi:hypothetical protein